MPGLASVLLLVCSCATAGPAPAEELYPEAGDLGTVTVGCFEADAAIAMAERAADAEAYMSRFFGFIAQGLCGSTDFPTAIELKVKVAGPYQDARGTWLEVWRARSQHHDTIFVFVTVARPHNVGRPR